MQSPYSLRSMIVTALIGVITVWAAVAAWRACSGTPVRAFIIISFDAARADVFPRTCGGSMPDGSMVALSRFCQRNIVFRNAYAPGPATWLSLPALYTGLDPPHHRVRRFPDLYLSPGLTTLAERFHKSGYGTYLTTGNRGMFDSRTLFDQGFDIVDIDVNPPHAKAIYGPLVSMNDVSRTAFWNPMTLVSKALFYIHGHCPRCMVHIHFAQPHDPYGAPLRYIHTVTGNRKIQGRLVSRLMEGPSGKITLPKNIVNRLRNSSIPAQKVPPKDYKTIRVLYKAGMVWAGSSLDPLFHALRKTPWWKDSVVLVTADHGEGFGEHRFWLHGKAVYDELVHIPLIVKIPGYAHQDRKELVSLTDIPVTFMHLIGRSTPELNRSTVDLVDVLEGRRHRAWVMSFGYAQVMVRLGRTKMIHFARGNRAVLYDMVKDPGEKRDLLPYKPELGAKIYGIMARNIILPQDPSRTSVDTKPLRETDQDLKALGYIGVAATHGLQPFNLAATRLQHNRVAYRWTIHRTADHHVILELVNQGRSAWPAHGAEQDRGAIRLQCLDPTGKRVWQGLLDHDLWPGRSVTWPIEPPPSPDHSITDCYLVQQGYQVWLKSSSTQPNRGP